MNRDETKEAISVMQAWVDGKEIESCPCVPLQHGMGWRYDPNPMWNWAMCLYRRKPKPREWKVTEFDDGSIMSSCRPSATSVRTIRVREVENNS